MSLSIRGCQFSYRPRRQANGTQNDQGVQTEMPATLLFPSRPDFSTQSVSQQISEFLRSAIVQGTIKPNQRLIEESIAKELGVSRTPVREAIRRLEVEGLVEYVPQRGAVVRQVSPEELLEIYDLRILLEGYAARLAATRIQAEGLSSLEKLSTSFDVVLNEPGDRADQVRKLMELNNQLHETIIHISGNKRLVRTLKVALEVPLIYRAYYWYDDAHKKTSDEYHKRILAAIRERNGTEAERLMQEHLIKAKDIILETMERISKEPVSQVE